jgi:hypothetical protein
MRRLLLTFGLAVSLSALYASPALARPGHHHKRKGAPEGAQKAPMYGPLNGVGCSVGGTPTPQTFGFAILNTPGDETTVTAVVALKGAPPNTTYEVNVKETDSPFTHICEGLGRLLTITTNKQGNGNLEFTVERRPGTGRFYVELKREISGGEEFLATPAVALD